MADLIKFHELPENVLLDIASLLTDLDLIAFSNVTSKCYQLSRSSILFWRHDSTPGLLAVSASNSDLPTTYSNPYRNAAFRSWRLRRSIARPDPMKVRLTKQIDIPGRPAVGAIIIPGTQYLLALTTRIPRGTPGVELLCLDLLNGVQIEVVGNVHFGTFLIDAADIKGGEEWHVAVTASDFNQPSVAGGTAVLAVYEAKLLFNKERKKQILEVKTLAQKTVSQKDLGQINKIGLEGHYIVVESFQLNHGWSRILHVLDWAAFDLPEVPPSKFLWRIPYSHKVRSWSTAAGHLFSNLYTQSQRTEFQLLNLDSLNSGPTYNETYVVPSEELSTWGIGKLAPDRKRATMTRDGLDPPLGAIMLEGNNIDACVCELSVRLNVNMTAPTWKQDGFTRSGKMHVAAAGTRMITGPSDAFKSATMSGGVFWTLEEKRGMFAHQLDRKTSEATVHIYDRDLKAYREIRQLPEGSYHLVDMDVGSLVGIEMQGSLTRVICHWLS